MRPLAIAAVLVALVACQDRRASAPPSDLHGTALGEPVPRPEFTLTATDGQPFNFRERTAGKLTFLFFGYTMCPDICPVHAANIAAVYKALSWEDRQRTTFVFVTLDPDRDSLVAIRKWLDHFDSSFVGLRGTVDEVNAIMAPIHFSPGVFGNKDSTTGRYEVQHSAAIYAFEPDDSARVVYTGGARQKDFAEDIPKLLARRKR